MSMLSDLLPGEQGAIVEINHQHFRSYNLLVTGEQNWEKDVRVRSLQS